MAPGAGTPGAEAGGAVAPGGAVSPTSEGAQLLPVSGGEGNVSLPLIALFIIVLAGGVRAFLRFKFDL